MPTFLFVYMLRLLLVVLLIHPVLGSSYTLVDDYQPSTFFEKFNFFAGVDPTNGYVQYVNSSYASSHGLARTYVDHVTFGVDTTHVFSPNAGGRPSVRLSSIANYTRALYILSLSHMPDGCGTWPAFWSLGPDWPSNGEIDIIEGVNLNTKNLMSLHTSDNCTIAGANQTGILETSNCNEEINANSGCGIEATSIATYGSNFNAQGGGIYAMEWTSNYIRIWFFDPTNIPSSITSGHPDPDTFGTPSANFQGSCDIDTHFSQHNIIFDITFCGDYAGNNYGGTACPMTSGASGYQSCIDFVANNPKNFTQTYWEIEYLKVYQRSSGITSSSVFSIASLSSVIPAASTNSEILSSLSNAGQGVNTSSTTTSSAVLSLPASTTLTKAPSYTSTYTGPNTLSEIPTPIRSSMALQSTSVATHLISYNYVGCWSDSAGDRTLRYERISQELGGSENMTVENCAATCLYHGSTYMGVEYYYQCFCDDRINADSVAVNESYCNSPCFGNYSETCGGTFYLNLYSIASSGVRMTPSTGATTTIVTVTEISNTNRTTATPIPSSIILTSTAATRKVASTTRTRDTSNTYPSYGTLPTTTDVPECHTMFSNSEGQVYRIYCNATINDSNLLTTVTQNFIDCISLCDLYQNECEGVVYNNITDPSTCELKTPVAHTDSFMVKEVALISSANNTFAAIHLTRLSPVTPNNPSEYPTLPYQTSTSLSITTSVSIIVSTIGTVTTTMTNSVMNSIPGYVTSVSLCFTCALTPTLISTVFPLSFASKPDLTLYRTTASTLRSAVTCPAPKRSTITKWVQTTITSCVTPLICPASTTSLTSLWHSDLPATNTRPHEFENCSTTFTDRHVFDDAMGVQYQILCGEVINSKPLTTFNASNIRSCAAACDMWNTVNLMSSQTCQAISYYGNNVSPNCYVYPNSEPRTQASGCDSGIVLGRPNSHPDGLNATTSVDTDVHSSTGYSDGTGSGVIGTTATMNIFTSYPFSTMISNGQTFTPIYYSSKLVSGMTGGMGTNNDGMPGTGATISIPAATSEATSTSISTSYQVSTGISNGQTVISNINPIQSTYGISTTTGSINETVTAAGAGSTVYVTQISTVVSYSVSYVYETQTQMVSGAGAPSLGASSSSRFCRTLATHYERMMEKG